MTEESQVRRPFVPHWVRLVGVFALAVFIMGSGPGTWGLIPMNLLALPLGMLRAKAHPPEPCPTSHQVMVMWIIWAVVNFFGFAICWSLMGWRLWTSSFISIPLYMLAFEASYWAAYASFRTKTV